MLSKLVFWLEQVRANIFLKLLSGFIAVSLFMVGLTLFSLFTFAKLGDSTTQVYQSQQQVNVASHLYDSVLNLKNSTNRLVVDINTINRESTEARNSLNAPAVATILNPYILDYRSQRQAIDDILSTIKSAADNFALSGMPKNETIQFSGMLNTDFQQVLKSADGIVERISKNQLDQTQAEWDTLNTHLNSAAQEVDQYLQALDQNLKRVSANSWATVEDGNSFRKIAQWVLVGLCGVALFLALLLGVILTYIFNRPVQKLKTRLESLAEGDLVTSLEVNNRDEFGDLGATFNQSITKLGDLVEQVQHQAVRISSAAAQIAAASRISANVSSDQAGAVAEATVTIEELSHTAQQIAEAASLVAQSAELALNSANEGQETVKESISGINGLKLQVQEIAEKILALNERSQRVGHIIEQITGIADQTHLLALNAAIESAAAGESGKRFAVVAAEVKKLAERSRSATKEVQAVLTEIQFATAASVMATEQGMKQAEQGVLLAHKSGDANESIMQMVERTVQLASAISLATQQQRSASEQVVASMRQLASIIQDGAASARQSSSLAASLDEVAVELKVVTNQFKVSEITPGSGGFGADGGPLETFEELAEVELLETNSTGGSGDAGGPELLVKPS